MCTVIGIIGTIVVAKIALRMMRCHDFGGCGGGWHRHRHHPFLRGGFGDRCRGRHEGPINLGDPGDLDERDRMYASHTQDVAVKVDEILRSLDLNARQAAEAGDVISIVRGAVGPDHYAHGKGLLLALRASAKLPFDSDLAEAAIGSRVSPAAVKEAVDALEHLHNILTDEQRAALEKLTSRSR